MIGLNSKGDTRSQNQFNWQEVWVILRIMLYWPLPMEDSINGGFPRLSVKLGLRCLGCKGAILGKAGKYKANP